MSPQDDSATTGTTVPRRLFLGWDGPFLPRVADWLLEQAQQRADTQANTQANTAAVAGAIPDLGRYLVVLPGRRAGRRLLEILSQLPAAVRGLVPPDVITLGLLPERLCPPDVPIASPLRQLLSRVAAMRALPESLGRLIPEIPAEDDLVAWSRLAEELERVDEELTVEGLGLEGAWRRLDAAAAGDELAAAYSDAERWRSLIELRAAAERELDRRGLQSLHQARLRALRRTHEARRKEAEETTSKGESSSGEDESSVGPSSPEEVRHVVLVGLTEFGALYTELLDGSDGQGPDVTVLVQAPESIADAFDPWGRPLESAWSERRLDLGRADVRMVERPSDQVAELVGVVEGWCGAGSATDPAPVDVAEVTVGLGDPTSSRAVQDALLLAGIESHSPLGRPFQASRPARLLEALGRYVTGGRLSDMAALLRHPDVERSLDSAVLVGAVLDEQVGEPASDAGGGRRPSIAAAIEGRRWLTLLDLYTSETLATRVGPQMPGDKRAVEVLGAIDGALRGLLRDPEEPAAAADRHRTLAEWSVFLAHGLDAIYGNLVIGGTSAADLELIESITVLGEALREQCELDVSERSPEASTGRGDGSVDAGLDVGQAIDLTLSRLGSQALAHDPPVRRPGVEVLGWLELALDDAPALVVAGLNEDSIPSSINADLLLPNHVRTILGLADNQRRFARDLVILSALVAGRERLTLIAGRRDAEDEPLRPSRLLLACDDEQLIARVLKFYPPDGESVATHLGRRVPWPHGERQRLHVPEPRADATRLERLSVTAFRDYLQCPYRFYLKHVERLAVVRDLPREMDGGAFGGLAHEVLRRFAAGATGATGAAGAAAASADVDAVRRELGAILDRVAAHRFGVSAISGGDPFAGALPAVRVQVAQLRRRLQAFADWQAETVRAGWSIQTQFVEEPLSATLDIDGEPFTLTGRIDRVDHHPDHGYRIIDYKTGDRAKTPDQVHRRHRPLFRPEPEPVPESGLPPRGTADQQTEWLDLQLPLYRLLALAAGIADPIELGFVQLSRDLRAEVWSPADWKPDVLEDAYDTARTVIRRIRDGVFLPPGEIPPFDDGLAWVAGDTWRGDARRPDLNRPEPGDPEQIRQEAT